MAMDWLTLKNNIKQKEIEPSSEKWRKIEIRIRECCTFPQIEILGFDLLLDIYYTNVW